MNTTLTHRNGQKHALNGLDAGALRQLAADVSESRNSGKVKFGVATHWRGGAQSESRVDAYEFDGRRIEKDFSIMVDEPRELLGGNAHPNPQEVLLAAFNACMLIGYVAGATVHGIRLESLTIETEGQLDVRGFLGL